MYKKKQYYEINRLVSIISTCVSLDLISLLWQKCASVHKTSLLGSILGLIYSQNCDSCYMWYAFHTSHHHLFPLRNSRNPRSLSLIKPKEWDESNRQNMLRHVTRIEPNRIWPHLLLSDHAIRGFIKQNEEGNSISWVTDKHGWIEQVNAMT